MSSGPSLAFSILLLLSHWLFHDESISVQSGRSNSCMVTLGLTGLQVGDWWLWGRVIQRTSLRRFGGHKNISKLGIKNLCPKHGEYLFSTIRSFLFKANILGHSEPFFL